MKKIILLLVILSIINCSNKKKIKLEEQIIKVDSLSEEKVSITDLGDNRFEVTVTELIYPNLSEEKMRERLIENAIQEATEHFRGIKVNSNTISILSENEDNILVDYFSKVINLSSEAIILEKDVKQEKKIIVGTNEYLSLVLYVKVGELVGEKDYDFNIFAELSKQHFNEGEKLRISVNSSQDCYLTIFCLYSNEQVSMLLPNKISKDNFIEAEKKYIIPAKHDNYSYTLQLLPDKKEDSETIFILATKQKISFPSFNYFNEYNTFESTLKDLMYQLSALPRSEVEQVSLQYFIHK